MAGPLIAEISVDGYANMLRRYIDDGVLDPDLLFSKLLKLYFSYDKESDLFQTPHEDFYNLILGMASILSNSSLKGADLLRFRRVRNWVENVRYSGNFGTSALVRDKSFPNSLMKFDARGDAVQHLLGGARVAVVAGEGAGQAAAFWVEVSDGFKRRLAPNDPSKTGFDWIDLEWTNRGAYLGAAAAPFVFSYDADLRKLLKLFADDKVKLSDWQSWYQKDYKIYVPNITPKNSSMA